MWKETHVTKPWHCLRKMFTLINDIDWIWIDCIIVYLSTPSPHLNSVYSVISYRVAMPCSNPQTAAASSPQSIGFLKKIIQTCLKHLGNKSIGVMRMCIVCKCKRAEKLKRTPLPQAWRWVLHALGLCWGQWHGEHFKGRWKNGSGKTPKNL